MLTKNQLQKQITHSPGPFSVLKCITILLTSFMILHVASHLAGNYRTVSDIQLRTAQNVKTWLPGFGEKVIIIIYTDYEGRKYTKPLANVSHKYRGDKRYKGIGIVNLKDNPLYLPDWLVKMLIRKNETKYKTELLFDEDHLLKQRWGLGDCDNKAVILIIDREKKLKYIKKVSSQKQCKAIVDEVISFITKEVEKSS